MSKGDNPNSRKNLKVPTSEEARKYGKKGGKISGIKRRNWATFRDCFKELMTPEDMEKAYAKLWELFLKDGKLEAFDRLKDVMDGGESAANNINITFASQEMQEYGD